MKKLSAAATTALALVAGPALAENVGNVGAVNETAHGTPPGASKRSLSVGLGVQRRELIETRPDGSAQIIFNDTSTMTVGRNSAVTVDDSFIPARDAAIMADMIMATTAATAKAATAAAMKAVKAAKAATMAAAMAKEVMAVKEVMAAATKAAANTAAPRAARGVTEVVATEAAVTKAGPLRSMDPGISSAASPSWPNAATAA